MRILAHLFKQPPKFNAGGQWMLHAILRDLVRRGHEVQVINQVPPAAEPTRRPYQFQGVTLIDNPGTDTRRQLYAWCDVAITHLDTTREALQRARAAGRPLVHVVHNDKQLERNQVSPLDTPLVVFNSEWLQRAVGWPGPQLVVNPPVFADEYRVEPGGAITLVNLIEAKGALVFFALARRLPERQFLGVLGAYGHQIVPSDLPTNVEIVPNTPDIREVLCRTRVLLMPSSYESWGRVAVEAAASGIPAIAHPTPGLREALGAAGLFVDRTDVDAWAAQIRALDDPETYRRQADLARARSAELDPAPQLDRLEAELVRLAGDIAADAPRVDCVAHLPHYVDHLAPIWHALPAEVRGRFLVRPEALRQARARQVEPREYQHDHQLVQLLAAETGPVVTAGYGDLRAANRSGRPMVFCEHGAGQSYAPHTDPAYAGGKHNRERVALFLCPNEYSAGLNRRRFPGTPAEVVGCPKLDAWHTRAPRPRGDPPVVAISFHWNGLSFPETRTSWPHYRAALPALARRFKLLGHGHPRIIQQLIPEYRAHGIEVVRDFQEVLERADCYVIDNSSTLFEFASTDRPVVVLNAPWYRRDVQHGLRFWDLAGIGVNCDRPEDLPATVERALADPPEQRQRREEAVAQVYPVRDGTAARRAAEAILRLLRAPSWPRRPVPAPAPENAATRRVRRQAEKDARRHEAQELRRQIRRRGGEIVQVKMLVRTYYQRQRLVPGQIVDLPKVLADRWCNRRRPLATVDLGSGQGPAPITPPPPEATREEVARFATAQPADTPPAPLDLGARTVAQLRALAEERGLAHKGLRKSELVAALSAGGSDVP